VETPKGLNAHDVQTLDSISNLSLRIEECTKQLDVKIFKPEALYQEYLVKPQRNENEEFLFHLMDNIRHPYIDCEARLIKRAIGDEAISSLLLSCDRSLYFDWDGKPILQWEYIFKWTFCEKHVGKTIINGWLISTVWLGLNHSFFKDHAPLIFETMIFKDNPDIPNCEICEHYQERYCTYESALIGHEEACETVKNHFKP
jgi:hypothetical protein